MTKPNRLINEKSPYLLQHAYNPVDWYPWGEEAFERARTEDKPIFLSIGYSTCYWCHVMEREVFEIESIAKLMNQFFVNIKVDREERPDVDRVYMAALQSMTGSGGWPMSMFLTPELKPFYGATYIPPESRHGLPGFEDLITQIHEAWESRRNDVISAGEEITEHIRKLSSYDKKKEKELSPDILKQAIQQFKSNFDEEYSGFGGAPKFPRPVVFNFLLRMYKKLGDNEALRIVIRTLLQMAKGGIHDHLGGGFHRYSVDRFWIVPHFEKMLYDQAQVASSYIDAFMITKDKYFEDIANDILQYVQRKLTAKQGGFYSAEDAESALDESNPHKKEEGAFYVWEKEEIDGILGKDDSQIICYYFGIGDYGNAPMGSDPHNVFTNKNILYEAHSITESANKFEKTVKEVTDIIVKSKRALFEIREKRPHPHLDDKILVSWNGLMISAFAKAFQVFDDHDYLDTAIDSAEFILSRLYDPSNNNNTLLHRYRDGEARFDGTLEDYAFFIQALIDLYESCFDEKYLGIALELTKTSILLFYDEEQGGFFDVTNKDKNILVRTKEDYDSAEPTGNSIQIMNLLRLSQFTENKKLYSIAEKSLKYFSSKILSQPFAMPQMLCAYDFSLTKPKQIIIAGKRDDELSREMLREVHSHFIPNKILIFAETGKENILIPFLSKIISQSGKTTSYICENYSCKLPTSGIDELRKLIEE
jgi:hypothetical protein